MQLSARFIAKHQGKCCDKKGETPGVGKNKSATVGGFISGLRKILFTIAAAHQLTDLFQIRVTAKHLGIALRRFIFEINNYTVIYKPA